MARVVLTEVASLVEDFDLYPRHGVDSVHTRRLVEAIGRGTELPPMVADRKSKRIIDGFHRVRAYRLALGEEAKVPVEFQDYEDEAAMLLAAIDLNARHGQPLAPTDHARIVILGERYGIDLDRLEEAAQVSIGHLKRLEVTVIGTSASGDKIGIKKAVRHLRGKRLTKAQEAVNRRLDGMRVDYHANIIHELVEADAIDLSDEHVLLALKRLHKTLSGFLKRVAEAA